jgi:hypothetical protein
MKSRARHDIKLACQFRNAYKPLVHQPGGKIPFGMSGRSWEKILKPVLKNQCPDVDWINPRVRDQRRGLVGWPTVNLRMMNLLLGVSHA